MMNDEKFKKFLKRLDEGKKERFVEELGDLCARYYVGGVVEMEYKRDEETHNETVTITFTSGTKEVVNVTCHNLATIVKDIFKVI